MLHHQRSYVLRLVRTVGQSPIVCGLSLVLLCLSATVQSQLDNRHYLPPMPAYAASNLLIELSSPSDEPVAFVLRSSLPGDDFVEMGTVQRGSPLSLTIERFVNAANGPGLIGHALASAATPLDHYGLVLEADGAVQMNVTMISNNNRDIFSSKGGNGLGTSFYAWSHYNTTGNATSTTNNDSGHFVSVMAIDDETVVTVEGPD
ncbi:MAG: hypothetical protein ACXIUL_03790 [Wenzhouxiangella sp.]